MHSASAVRIGDTSWEAERVLPTGALGCVLFVHGPGAAGCSCDRIVAAAFNDQGLATLRFEAAPQAPQPARLDFHAERVMQALDWLRHDDELAALPCGVYGAGGGALAAMAGAALRPGRIHAAVTQGASAELSAVAPERVVAPTLLIVGDGDPAQLAHHRGVLRQLPGVKRLEVVPQADRGLGEPGALMGVATLAAWWFTTHLSHPRRH